ncbi:hypothetical protein [Lactiplantibacillus plantarum]|uniref:hypothetical protein n=1 Tax=Lactiplantibacillus plantarum TaxID=1590 RepID=UPI0009772D51|nr:hypothetical protein [Lactiplantibacillus plantarum]
MNEEQLQQYVADNSQVETIFMGKATDYLNGKNKKRQPAKRWNEAMIQRQAEKMYAQVVEDLYNKLHTQVKANRFTPAEKWIKFINENEVLDGLEESMIELEFE